MVESQFGRTVVVTRHAGTIEYLRKRGYIPADAQIIEHATPAEVTGANVVGMLPYHMAALALSVTVVDLDIPPELRGAELSAGEIERYATGVNTYQVFRSEGGPSK